MTRGTADARQLAAHLEHFDALFRQNSDPWQYETAWPEKAKRRAVGGALGSNRIGSLLEIGCGNGVSTVALTRRAHRVDAIDGATSAVDLAQKRLRTELRCTVRQAELPMGMPTGPYDAVVATEVLYYLPSDSLEDTLDAMERTVRPGGLVVVTASVRPFGDRATTHVELFEATRRRLGRPMRKIVGGAWRLETYRPRR